MGKRGVEREGKMMEKSEEFRRSNILFMIEPCRARKERKRSQSGKSKKRRENRLYFRGRGFNRYQNK